MRIAAKVEQHRPNTTTDHLDSLGKWPHRGRHRAKGNYRKTDRAFCFEVADENQGAFSKMADVSWY